jgi:hypothetical protein
MKIQYGQELPQHLEQFVTQDLVCESFQIWEAVPESSEDETQIKLFVGKVPRGWIMASPLTFGFISVNTEV